MAETLPEHRRPQNIFVPVKRDGTRAQIAVSESRSVSDRQLFVTSIREDKLLKDAGAGCRTQQSPQVEAQNRALIAAIKGCAAEHPSEKFVLELPKRRFTRGDKTVAEIGTSGALEWLISDLRPKGKATS